MTLGTDDIAVQAGILWKDLKEGVAKGEHEMPAEDLIKRSHERLQALIMEIVRNKPRVEPIPPVVPLPVTPPVLPPVKPQERVPEALCFELVGEDLGPVQAQIRKLRQQNPGKKVLVRLEVVEE
jgi:hypothetical protein